MKFKISTLLFITFIAALIVAMAARIGQLEQQIYDVEQRKNRMEKRIETLERNFKVVTEFVVTKRMEEEKKLQETRAMERLNR